MATDDIRPEIEPRLVTAIAELWPLQHDWTEADYFALPETNRLIELSEGVLIVPPHPTDTHQRIVLRLVLMFQTFVERRALGIVRFAPLPVRLWPGKIREPDILFVARAHFDRVGEQAYGPPDLVVEVTSPSTRQTDRVDKLQEYARAGVPEHWLVDPEAETIEVFVLERDAYRLSAKAGTGESVGSQLLAGLEVAVDEVFSR